MELDTYEKDAITHAINLQKKSLERAAKAYELEGRKATAEAVRGELATLTKLGFKINDTPTKTPQAKA